jgi:cardiolipin synthase
VNGAGRRACWLDARVPDLSSTRRRLEALLGIPATEGNEVVPLRNGVRIFPAMLDAIHGATASVDLLTYIYWTGRPARAFADALADRASHGVRVRVLVDAVGGLRMNQDLVAEMREAGVDVQFFRPPWIRSPFSHNHRTHRKVLVVDESVAFTGGVGIAEEWDGDARDPSEWRDTHLQVRGPAVAGLQAAFVQNWAETTGDPNDDAASYPVLTTHGSDVVHVVRGTASLGWDDIQTAWYGLLTHARERVTLQTAYFAPDASFLSLLTETARRGVQVDLLLPGPHYDKTVSRLGSERHYSALLDAGVTVRRYQRTMLHTKVLTVDESIAMVGSSNYNRRSLDHDEEVAVIVYGGSVPQELVRDFTDDCAEAERVDAGQWRQRPPTQRLGEVAVAPLSRYL